jgi:hypothetical protein
MDILALTEFFKFLTIVVGGFYILSALMLMSYTDWEVLACCRQLKSDNL